MARDPDAKHRRLAAIVFTDIVGFSAIVNRDEAAGARALDLQRRIVRRQVSIFGGREIETAGDSFLLEFASPYAGLRCVAAIQRGLGSRLRCWPVMHRCGYGPACMSATSPTAGVRYSAIP